MLKKVRKLFYPGKERALTYLAGILFCGLLMAFAVTSKAAAYSPHDVGSRPITATKIWQQQDPVMECVPPTGLTDTLIPFSILATAALAVTTRFMAWRQTAFVSSPFELCDRRTPAIRPPPRR